MKDIYSPLEIDEEWDDMAPVGAAGPEMGGEGSTATAVAVKPEMTTSADQPVESSISTLPPEDSSAMPEVQSNVMPGAEMKSADVMTDAGTNETAASQNDAYGVAEMAIGEADKAMPGANTMQDETLNVSDTTSQPTATMVAEAPVAEVTGTEVPTPLKIDVKKADEEEPAISDATAGATFAPVLEPKGGIREDMKPEEEPVQDEKPAEEPKAEEPKEELPVSPADHQEKKEPKHEVEYREAAHEKSEHPEGSINKYLKMLEDTKAEALEGIGREIDSAEKKVADYDDKMSKLQETFDSEMANLKESRGNAQKALDTLNEEKTKIESSVS